MRNEKYNHTISLREARLAGQRPEVACGHVHECGHSFKTGLSTVLETLH